MIGTDAAAATLVEPGKRSRVFGQAAPIDGPARTRCTTAVPAIGSNLLLRSLPGEAIDRLAPFLRTERLARGQPLDHALERERVVVLPLDGVVSLVATDLEGRAIEVAVIGREGIVGAPGPVTPTAGSAFLQVPGSVMTIAAARLEGEVARSGAVARGLARYTEVFVLQTSQAVICMRHHPVGARVARSLLAIADRVGQGAFEITQEYLGLMLGRTRPQVSVAAEALRDAGLIRYARGIVEILDRPGLEAATCECYWRIRDAFRSLYGPDAPGG